MTDPVNVRIAESKQIRIGGLMRCCIATFEQTDTSGLAIGDKLPCTWCKASMVRAADGIWEWERNEGRTA